MKRCKKCVYPVNKPDLQFHEGLCSACRSHLDNPRINWTQRRDQLEKLLRGSRKSPDGHDCIVPSSGGKDSTYQALMIREMGFKPLCVTASTCFLTPMGRHNINALRAHCDTIEVDPDWDVRRKLNVLGQELVGDISWPEHAAIFSVPFRMARDLGMDLIVYGECPQKEYGGPIDSDKATDMTKRWVSEFGGLLGLRPADFVGQDGITAEDMAYYELPTDEDLENIRAIWLGQFLRWDSHANWEMAKRIGFRCKLPSLANWWEFENLDNAMTGIHDHMMYRKYGYGRLAGQISVDIRKTLMNRSAALDVIKVSDGLFPYEYAGVHLDKVLGYLGKNLSWLDETMDMHTTHELFGETVNRRPILKEFKPLELVG
jgi:N-acetyl sugar amidotransferase